MIHSAVISLGSNSASSVANIRRAVGSLSALGSIVASSPEPSGDGYANCVAELLTSLDFEALHDASKLIETEMGRIPREKAEGRVEIDIDIVYFDSKLLRPLDAARPYFLDGLKTLKDVKLVVRQS